MTRLWSPAASRDICGWPTLWNAWPAWRLTRGNHPHAARLLGAADGIRQRLGHARFPMYQAGYDATVAAVREALGQAILTPRGPKAPPCPSRKRSLMRNAVAASANVRPVAGGR